MENVLKGKLGFKGERGYSAYEIAVQNGFVGSEKDWLAQLGTSTKFERKSVIYEATEGQTEFDIPEYYTSDSFIDVYVDGEHLDTTEYTLNTDTMKFALTNAITVEGTKVEVITITMATNNLVANVKNYGAVGDGVADDTEAFIEAYKVASESHRPVNIPEGKYLISNKIEIPIFVKTIIQGTVIILSDVSDGATIHYTSGGVETPTSGLKYQTNNSIVDGAIIDGGNLILQRTNNYDDINSDNESIGLLIGDDEADISKIHLARCNFNNITITGFKKALAIRPINTYLLTFNNIHTENDYYGVYIGGENKLNSGENITFNNCIFSHHYHAVCNDFEYMCGLNFNECAFDFNANHVLQNTHGNVLHNFKGCHFEGVGYADETQIKATSENVGFGSIFHRNTNNKYTRSLAIFDTCYFHLATFTPSNHLFTAEHTTRPYNIIKLINYGISWAYDKLTLANRFMADENTEIELSAPDNAIDYQPYNGSNNDIIGKLENIPNNLSLNYTNTSDKATFEKLGFELSVNTWSSTNVNVSIDTTKKIFDKALLVEQKSFNTNCGLTRIVETLSKRYISNVAYFQLGDVDLEDTSVTDYELTPQVRYRFYDKNDNLIKEHSIPCDNYKYIEGKWVCVATLAKIPVGASKCMLLANAVLKNGEDFLNFKGTVLFGGHIIELMD